MNEKCFSLCPSQTKPADRWRLSFSFLIPVSYTDSFIFPWSLADNRRIAYTCFWRYIFSPKSISTPTLPWPYKKGVARLLSVIILNHYTCSCNFYGCLRWVKDEKPCCCVKIAWERNVPTSVSSWRTIGLSHLGDARGFRVSRGQ